MAKSPVPVVGIEITDTCVTRIPIQPTGLDPPLAESSDKDRFGMDLAVCCGSDALVSQFPELAPYLLTAEDLTSQSQEILAAVGLSRFLVQVEHEPAVAPVPHLPFDLSPHPESHSSGKHWAQLAVFKDCDFVMFALGFV